MKRAKTYHQPKPEDTAASILLWILFIVCVIFLTLI